MEIEEFTLIELQTIQKYLNRFKEDELEIEESSFVFFQLEHIKSIIKSKECK